MLFGARVRELLDLSLRNAHADALGWVHFDCLVVVAKSQDGLGLSSFRVGHRDPPEGSFSGEAECYGKQDREKNRNDSFHGPESISKPELEWRTLRRLNAQG
jgi:hypothetical protein